MCLLADLAFAGGNALWNLRRALSHAPRKEPLGFWTDFVRFNLLGHELPDMAPPAAHVAARPETRATVRKAA